MMHYYVVGVDPGLASTGVVALRVPEYLAAMTPQEAVRQARILTAYVVSTKPDKNIRSKEEDRVRRVMHIVREVLRWPNYTLDDDKHPDDPAVTRMVLAAEAFSLGQRRGMPVSIAGLYTLAVYGALVGATSAMPGSLFFQVSPGAMKQKLTGSRSATKKAIYALRQADLEQAGMMAQVLRYPGRRKKAMPWPASKNEHVGDAFGVAAVALLRLQERMTTGGQL